MDTETADPIGLDAFTRIFARMDTDPVDDHELTVLVHASVLLSRLDTLLAEANDDLDPDAFERIVDYLQVRFPDLTPTDPARVLRIVEDVLKEQGILAPHAIRDAAGKIANTVGNYGA
jgi:hypothetical protein